jgi:hypothetical protein
VPSHTLIGRQNEGFYAKRQRLNGPNEGFYAKRLTLNGPNVGFYAKRLTLNGPKQRILCQTGNPQLKAEGVARPVPEALAERSASRPLPISYPTKST